MTDTWRTPHIQWQGAVLILFHPKGILSYKNRQKVELSTHDSPRSLKCCPMTLMLSCSRSLKFLFFCLSGKALGEEDSNFCFILPRREKSPSSCVAPAPFCDDGTADPLADISERRIREPR